MGGGSVGGQGQYLDKNMDMSDSVAAAAAVALDGHTAQTYVQDRSLHYPECN